MQVMRVNLPMAAAMACLLATAVYGQPPQFGGRDGGRGPANRGPGEMLRLLPVMKALDANGDGEISADEIKNSAQALAALDKNEDGKLTLEELRPELPVGGERGQGPFGVNRPEGGGQGVGARAGNPQENLERLMALDKNADGKLSKDELPERIQGMLTRFDADQDGALSKEELQKAAEQQRGPEGRGSGGGPEMVARLFADNDANNDGKLAGDEIPGRMKENLDRIDTNRDGAIDKKELEALSRFFQGARGGDVRGPGEGFGGVPRGGIRPTDRLERPDRPQRPDGE